MRSEDLIRGVVRVWTDDRTEIVGTGVLVAPDLVLTCAHVAARAWGEDPEIGAGAGRAVQLDLPAVAPRQFLDTTVAHWLPRRPAPGGAYDLAGLRLNSSAPTGAKPLPLVVEEAPWGRPCRIFGFPGGRPDGSYASGTLRDVLANGWVLIKGEADAREFTRPGYSGGPVLTEAGVVGLLTEGDRDVRVREAVMVPVRTILGAWPELHGIVARSPYPGLAAFTAQDVPYFRGRSDLADELADALEKPPHLLVLAGPSGSGKSSLLAAGVLPRLETRDGDGRRCVLWTPGKAPYATLARALLRARDPHLEEVRISVESARLARDLESGRVALAHVLAQDPASRWVVAVDQPEELLLDNGHAAAYVPPARRLFDDLLAVLSDERVAGRLAVIVAVRTDYLDALLRSPRLLGRGGEIVRYLGPVEELREVIEAPLLESGFAGLEAGLTDRILADVGDVPNPLPLLQFTLAALWRNQRAGRLTHAAYDELGGVRRALANHAERTVASFSEEELTAARDVLLQLGRPGLDDSVARRAARFDELGERGRLVVPRLADARLVVTDRDAEGVERVEVVHETLYEHWPRLRAWWLESVDFRRWQESLRFALRVWRDGSEHPTDLLRGPRLRVAEGHLRGRAGAFTQEELAFVMRSSEHEFQQSEVARQVLNRQLQMRRRLNLVLAVGMAVAASFAGITVWQMSSVQRLRADTERLLHSTSQANAALESLAGELEESLGESKVVLARRLSIQAVAMATAPSTFGGDLRLAALMASHAVRLDPGPESYDHLLRVLQAHPSYRATLAVTATAVALSPDGRTVAVGDAFGRIGRWDGLTGARLSGEIEALRGPVTALAFSPDGSLLASGGADGGVSVWEMGSLTRHRSLLLAAEGASVVVISATSDGSTWVAVDLVGTVRAWDVASGRGTAMLSGAASGGQPSTEDSGIVRDAGIPVLAEALGAITTVDAHSDWRSQLAVHPALPLVALPQADRVVVLNARTLVESLSVPIDAASLGGIAFDADGSTLVVAMYDGGIEAWDLVARTSRTWNSRVAGIRRIAAAPEPGVLLLALGDGNARWVDYRREAVREPRLHGHDLPLVDARVESGLVVTRSRDGRVVTWDREARLQLHAHLASLGATPRAVAVDQASGVAYFGSPDGGLFSVSFATGSIRSALQGAHAGELFAIAATPGRLASVGRDGMLISHDPVTLERLTALYSHDASLVSVAPHPSEDAWLVGGAHGLVQQVGWDGTQSTARRAPSRGWSPSAVVAVASDGRTLAYAFDDVIELWRDGGMVARAEILEERDIKGLAFDVTGTRLLSSGSGLTTLWQVPDLSVVARWVPATPAALSPDGAWIAMAQEDGSVQLFDAETLERVGAPLTGSGQLVTVLTFSPDSRSLIVGDINGEIVVWNVGIDAWLNMACSLAWRDLTDGEARALFGEEAFQPVCEARDA